MQKKTNKQESFLILTPLPQLKLSGKAEMYGFGRVSIGVFKPRLRRILLDIAKAENCSEDMFLLLVNSETIFCAEIPFPTPTRSRKIYSAYYSRVAQEILKRIFNCLLLFNWVPAPLLSYCWFTAIGCVSTVQSDSLEPLDSDYEYIDTFYNIDWRSPSVEPVDITLGCEDLRKFWNKLSPLCQIEQLNTTYTNKHKQHGYIKAAKEYEISMMEEYLKARYGNGVTIDRESHEVATKEDLQKREDIIWISEKLQAKWFLDGYFSSYRSEIDKLSMELDKKPSNNRFIRSFQFFINGIRLPNPHRFIAIITCLESLFGKETREITFQLCLRIAWFLNPKNPNERVKIFEQVNNFYKLRSKIVHGAKFSTDKLEEAENELLFLVRSIFWKILSIDDIYKIAFEKDTKSWDKLLDKLILGQPDQD